MLRPSSAVCCGTAQEAVRDAARVNVPSRNGPGVVDACGHGVGGARRVEGGYLAVVIPHEAMRRPAAVVDSCDHSRGVDAIGKSASPSARSIQNGDLSVALPHEAMHRLSIVSIEIPYDLPRRVDRPRHGAQHINAARRTSLPRGGTNVVYAPSRERRNPRCGCGYSSLSS
jgi:hypothetical protein